MGLIIILFTLMFLNNGYNYLKPQNTRMYVWKICYMTLKTGCCFNTRTGFNKGGKYVLPKM